MVGSVNNNFEISTFSNAGNRVDIFAPGENIYSTVPSANRYEADGWSGTSMASPHVAGVCANVWSMNNNLTGAEVKQIVCDMNNCVQHINVSFSLPNSDTQLTRGIADCYRAVTDSRVTNQKHNNTDTKSNMGSVLGWVVERDENQNDNFLSAAVIRAYQHGQTEPVHFSSIDRDFEVSDIYGHFELILNPGTYDITVQYSNYEVKRKENITVEAGQVHYLNEYIIFEKTKEAQTTTMIQNSEKQRIITTEVPPAQTPAVIDPYEELLKRYSDDEYYMLVDLIGDSNLELIIRTGTCEADFMFEFWYNDNGNPVCMGEVGGGHSSLHINPNTKELYRNYAHMDFQEISKVLINYNSVSDEKIAEFGDSKHTNSFYTEHYYYNMDIPCITEKSISEYKYEASDLSYEYCETMTLEEYTRQYREAEKKAAASSLSENELKNKARNYGNIEYWAYYDFDGNGQKEAFALITSQSDADPSGDYYQRIEHILYLNAAGDIKDIPDDYMDYVNGTGVFFTTSDGRGWFSIAHTAQGPASPNLLYGVYNDTPIKKDYLNLDGGIIVHSNGNLSAWITYAPPRTYEEYELLYDEFTTEFYLGEKLKEE